MEVAEARRLRALEEANARLKRVVVDQPVQIQILKEVNAKNGELVKPATGGEAHLSK
jgi:putative transposase